MTIISDFLTGSKSVDGVDPITALDRAVHRDLQPFIDKGDVASPDAAFDGTDEVQELAASGASAGTFDIAVGVNSNVDGEVFVAVTGIAFNAAVSAIQTALDSAAGSAISDYTAGDIVVASAGTPDLNPVTFTYSGTSVAAKNHPLSTVDGGSLTGGGSEAFSESTGGQTSRAPWAIMQVFSLVGFTANTPPTQGGSLPALTNIINRSQLPFTDATLRALAREAASQDEIPGLEAAILDAMNLQPHPPASSHGLA